MKKTVTTTEYLCVCFLLLAWIFGCSGAAVLAGASILAAVFCLGVDLGSLAYDVFHMIRSRKEGGE